jgi:uncharacterized protein (TIGR00730 family)
MRDNRDNHVRANTAGEETWRVFRIMSEFVEGFERLGSLGPAVSVFGSARIAAGDRYYEMAQKMGAELVRHGFAVITGGGPGIMEAANKGAIEAGGDSVGLNIYLPQEQRANDYQTLGMDFHYFFCRKVMFLKYALALVCFPGGFGTMDEFFESMTLIQTERVERYPVVLCGADFWTPMIENLRVLLLQDRAYIDPHDLDLVTITDDMAWAADHIAEQVHKQQELARQNQGKPRPPSIADAAPPRAARSRSPRRPGRPFADLQP